MEDDREQRPESLLPYEDWTEAALRQVAAQAIEFAAANGLPGGHHFYLTFRTDHPGVMIPQRLREQYPQEMTIVLQHQFWDLKLDRETRVMSVGLSFSGVPATLVIPLDAIVGFADPHIRYGLRFRPVIPETPRPPVAVPAPAAEQPDKPDQAEDSEADKADAPSDTPQVVSLDAFRRRTPPKT
ncbi:MAG: SspB family protein [Acetobacteraceae bacterium]